MKEPRPGRLRFGHGWRSVQAGAPGQPGHTEAIWRYSFKTRPSWLSPIADRIGQLVLGYDIDRRIAGYARGCVDPVVLRVAEKDIAIRGD